MEVKQILSIRRQRAAKQHICSNCKEPIRFGDIYSSYAVVKLDGSFENIKLHYDFPTRPCLMFAPHQL